MPAQVLVLVDALLLADRDVLALAGVAAKARCRLRSFLQFFRQRVEVPHKDVVNLGTPLDVVRVADHTLVAGCAAESRAARRREGCASLSFAKRVAANEQREALASYSLRPGYGGPVIPVRVVNILNPDSVAHFLEVGRRLRGG